MSNFNSRLKALRTEFGLSQNALAKKINSSQKIIDYWEKGESEPKANFIVSLADVFGVTCDYLLGREDELGNVNINSDLSESEKLLIATYNRSTDKDKETLLAFAKYLSDRHPTKE